MHIVDCPSNASLSSQISVCDRLKNNADHGTAAGSRKRVRFDSAQDDDDQARRVKVRVVETTPKPESVDDEEKRARWLQPEDKLAIRRSASVEAQALRREDNRKILRGQAQSSFAEIYSCVHSLCLHANLSDTDDIVSLVSPEIVTLVANHGGRGLEDQVVPKKALERRELRHQSIRAVLMAQKHKNDPELIRDVARAFTQPSRLFAQALGVADATAAMMEYSSMYQMEEMTKPPPSDLFDVAPLACPNPAQLF